MLCVARRLHKGLNCIPILIDGLGLFIDPAHKDVRCTSTMIAFIGFRQLWKPRVDFGGVIPGVFKSCLSLASLGWEKISLENEATN